MAKSLRASAEGLALVDKARSRRGWTRTSTASWWQEAHTSRATLRRFWQGDRIQQEIFIALCQVVGIEQWQSVAATESECEQPLKATPQLDFSQAPMIELFYGREPELAFLKDCIQTRHTQLIAITGMGGMGKTALALAFVEQVQEKFEWVIWRSLQMKPPLANLLEDILYTIDGSIPQTINQSRKKLFDSLKQHRCLLILDGLESVFQVGNSGKGYNPFLQQILNFRHQSCILLTSQIEPAIFEIASPQATHLQLKGLNTRDALILLKASGLSGEVHDLTAIARLYGGNPLALKLVIPLIQSIFGGNVSRFLRENALPVGDRLQTILLNQFNQLPQLEQDILYWLAIWREPVSLGRLQSHFLFTPDPGTLIQGLAELERRSLLEKYVDTSEPTFTLQPLVMQIITNTLVQKVAKEIGDAIQAGQDNQFETSLFKILRTHWLLRPGTDDIAGDLILNAIQNQLFNIWGSSLLTALQSILMKLENQPPQIVGYAGCNLSVFLKRLY